MVMWPGLTVTLTLGSLSALRKDQGPGQAARTALTFEATHTALARQLDADVLLLLTDVAAVQDGYGTPQAHPIRDQIQLATSRVNLAWLYRAAEAGVLSRIVDFPQASCTGQRDVQVTASLRTLAARL